MLCIFGEMAWIFLIAKVEQIGWCPIQWRWYSSPLAVCNAKDCYYSSIVLKKKIEGRRCSDEKENGHRWDGNEIQCRGNGPPGLLLTVRKTIRSRLTISDQSPV